MDGCGCDGTCSCAAGEGGTDAALPDADGEAVPGGGGEADVGSEGEGRVGRKERGDLVKWEVDGGIEEDGVGVADGGGE